MSWIRALVLLAAALALTATGCKKEEDPATIKGRVTVQDGDAAGVVVELYAEPTFGSDSPWNVAATYPTVGFPYTPQAAFDYRIEGRNTTSHPTQLRASLTTGADGKFEFRDVPGAAFVVVARKEGFGWSVPVGANISGGSADVGVLTLRPEIVLPATSVIEGNVTWEGDRHYVVPSLLRIAANARLTIQPGAVVRLGQFAEVRVSGALDCQGTSSNYIHFTSDQLVNPSIDWEYIQFDSNAEPPLFRYCTFSFCDRPVYAIAPGGTVEYCLFREIGTQGVELTGVQNSSDAPPIVVRGNIFDHIETGMRIVQVWNSGVTVERNAVFTSANFGMYLHVWRGGDVFCNYVYGCGRSDSLTSSETGGIYLRDMRDVNVSRNEVEACWYGFILGSRVDSTVEIGTNRFVRNFRGIYVGFTPDQSGPSYPTVRANCFERTDSFVIYLTACRINNRILRAHDNYWGTTSEADILNRFIRDCDEDAECPCVDFRPIELTCATGNTGICR